MLVSSAPKPCLPVAAVFAPTQTAVVQAQQAELPASVGPMRKVHQVLRRTPLSELPPTTFRFGVRQRFERMGDVACAPDPVEPPQLEPVEAPQPDSEAPQPQHVRARLRDVSASNVFAFTAPPMACCPSQPPPPSQEDQLQGVPFLDTALLFEEFGDGDLADAVDPDLNLQMLDIDRW
mmetsp:Transcript_64788/g.141183  ORF Transcript_64788/g.141183 Transcript_64788/m.141183 type:complete len:178 (+) Transcript_64788:823-1356(+)